MGPKLALIVPKAQKRTCQIDHEFDWLVDGHTSRIKVPKVWTSLGQTSRASTKGSKRLYVAAQGRDVFGPYHKKAQPACKKRHDHCELLCGVQNYVSKLCQLWVMVMVMVMLPSHQQLPVERLSQSCALQPK